MCTEKKETRDETRPSRPPEATDPVVEAYKRDIDRSLLRRNLRKTVEERILAAMELQRLAEEVRAAAKRMSARDD